MSEARIVFEPTAYDGSEASRVNLVLEANEEDIKAISAWESKSRNKTLCSAITTNGLRVKINKDTVRCWKGKKRAPLPGKMKDNTCNAIMQWTGTWETKNQRGLCLRAAGVEVMGQEIEYPFGQ